MTEKQHIRLSYRCYTCQSKIDRKDMVRRFGKFEVQKMIDEHRIILVEGEAEA